MSKHHHHGHKHHDHKKAEPKKTDALTDLLHKGKDGDAKKDEPIAKDEAPAKDEPLTPPATPEAKLPSDDKTAPESEKAAEPSIADEAPAAVEEGKEEDKKPDLFVSESQKVQEANSNTTTGMVVNPGTTDAAIEIVQHVQPAVEAALAAQKRDQAIADGETPEYHPEADAMNPGPKVEEIAGPESGNSITGATAPEPFHPWDDAKEKDDAAKDELAQNLTDAAKPATADGQADGPVPYASATEAEHIDGSKESVPGTSDLENASGLSATDETAPISPEAEKTDEKLADESKDKADEVLQ